MSIGPHDFSRMHNLLANHHSRLLGVLLATLGACVPAKLDLFDSDPSGGPGGTTADGATTGATDGPMTDATTGATTDATTGGGPMSCDDPLTDCADDLDRDGAAAACDNAPMHANPEQSDIDGDGFGDVIDKCPTVPSAPNLADSDQDGIGNECDLCMRWPESYNGDSPDIPAYMRVRNIPQVEDSDKDGVGDACDNCVRTPNCQGFGVGLDPFELGDAIDYEAFDCQVDADVDRVGDACAGAMMPGAAGPVGFGDDDDFDQDGLRNIVDVCPRQPVAAQACDGPGDCPDGASCTDGACNHRDSDLDGVGDICDTCPWAANPKQILEGGAEVDDPDGDFVGEACEAATLCGSYPDPRPFGFYDGSVGGYCCVQRLDGGTVLDPHGDPVAPPAKVQATPGVGALPPGCALEAQSLDPVQAGDALWSGFCLLPQWDQDFDGVGDSCDLCPFAFDPGQETVVVPGEDAPVGAFCHGEFSPSELDPTMMCLPGT